MSPETGRSPAALGDVVLNNVSEQIRECYWPAEDYAQKAAVQIDPKLKADFFSLGASLASLGA